MVAAVSGAIALNVGPSKWFPAFNLLAYASRLDFDLSPSTLLICRPSPFSLIHRLHLPFATRPTKNCQLLRLSVLPTDDPLSETVLWFVRIDAFIYSFRNFSSSFIQVFCASEIDSTTNTQFDYRKHNHYQRTLSRYYSESIIASFQGLGVGCWLS
jgi:hypothetical protein